MDTTCGRDYIAVGDGTMQTPEWLPEYGATAFAALVGSVARGKSWITADGKFHIARLVTELSTAVGFGMIVISAGDYFHVDLRVLIGIAVFGGWLGPAAAWDFVQSLPVFRGLGK